MILDLLAAARGHCLPDLPFALGLAAKSRKWGPWRIADKAAM